MSRGLETQAEGSVMEHLITGSHNDGLTAGARALPSAAHSRLTLIPLLDANIGVRTYSFSGLLGHALQLVSFDQPHTGSLGQNDGLQGKRRISHHPRRVCFVKRFGRNHLLNRVIADRTCPKLYLYGNAHAPTR